MVYCHTIGRRMQESTRMRIEGDWDRFRGTLRAHWGDIQDDDLDKAGGEYEQLVGVIKERTGQDSRRIEELLDDLARKST